MFRPSMVIFRPIFELVQVLFKIYIVRSGIPCAYTHGISERKIYILNKTWTSSKIGPEDDHKGRNM